jgi:hypothetical protein
LTVRGSEIEWLKVPLLPVIVNGNVPVLAFRFTEILRVELPGAVTGLVLKLALVFGGKPLTLKLTEVGPPPAVSEMIELPVEPRLMVSDVGDAEIPKSGAGAETTTVRVVEWLRAPLVPLVVIEYEPAGVLVGTVIVSDVLAELLAGGVSELVPKVQVIPPAPPHAFAGVKLTAELNPFSDCTVTLPVLVLPPTPCVNVSGVAADDMLKSGVPVQLLNLNEPIAVFQT